MITNTAFITIGIGDTLGNKGGVSIYLKVGNTTMVFTNAHLAAHQTKVEERNNDYHKINNKMPAELVKRSRKTGSEKRMKSSKSTDANINPNSKDKIANIVKEDNVKAKHTDWTTYKKSRDHKDGTFNGENETTIPLKLQKGDKVEARYRGREKWFKGKISEDRGDGTFDVDYDDGEKETRVREDLIRSLETHRSPSHGVDSHEGIVTSSSQAPLKLQKGDKVEARYRGREKWFKGKISEDRGDGTFDVDYDDGEKETRVREDLIRSLETHRSPSSLLKVGLSDAKLYNIGESVEARFNGGDEWFPGKIATVSHKVSYDVRYDDGDHERCISAEKVRSDAMSKNESDKKEHRVGDTVEALFHGDGQWYRGTIIALNYFSYSLIYDDGDEESGVTAEYVRAIDNQRENGKINVLDVGSKVEVQFKGGSKWFPGKIISMNRDGSCDVLYDDGEEELRVPVEFVRLTGVGNGNGTKRGVETEKGIVNGHADAAKVVQAVGQAGAAAVGHAGAAAVGHAGAAAVGQAGAAKAGTVAPRSLAVPAAKTLHEVLSESEAKNTTLAQLAERVFFMGDLNYRIKGNRAVVDKLLAQSNFEVLWNNDQLRISMQQRLVFEGYIEAPVTFRPTFKFDRFSDTYDTSEKQVLSLTIPQY